MASPLQSQSIGSGITFHRIQDKKFKHNRISVNFILPLQRETATVHAVLPFLMQRGYRDCADFTQFSRRLDELYGAAVSGNVSKAGEYQIITLSITCVDDRYTMDGEQITAQCAQLLADMVCRPNITDGRFDPAVLELEKNSLLDTILSERNDKRAYANLRCSELLFEGTAAAVKQYGYAEDVAAITPESAAQAYAEMMRTAAVEIIMAGASDNGQIAGIFAEAFAAQPRQPVQARLTPAAFASEQVREVTEQMDLTQAKMVLGFTSQPVHTSREEAAARVATAIYGGTAFSKLFLHVREKLSLCYYCAARSNTATASMLVDCGVEAANKEKAQQEILHQLSLMQQGSFTEEELHNAKLAAVNSLRASGDSLSVTDRWYLSKILRGETGSPEEEIAEVQAVSADEVAAFMKTMRLAVVYLLAGEQKKGA